MEVQNALANRIDTAGEDITYDEACKQVLANKIILAWIMKGCLKEYKDCSVNEIAEKYIEGEPEVSKATVHVDESAEFIEGSNTENATMKEGTVKFDIKFKAILPETKSVIDMIINVEAQNDFYPGYPIVKRGVYYGCRLVSAQYGTLFENSEYDKVKPVASIWICPNPPEYRKNTITCYHITEESIVGNAKENPDNYDLVTVIVVCLGGEGKEGYDGLLKMLDVLLSQDTQPADKKRILKEEFSIPMTKKLEGDVDAMCNLSQGVYDKAKVEDIQKMMEKKGWDIEECMDVLDIPSGRRQVYRDIILGTTAVV